MTSEILASEPDHLDGPDDRPHRRSLPVWQESILLLGVALVLAIVIKAFFVQAFYIPSESMEPGLVKNDRILVEKWSYWGSGTGGLPKLLTKVGLYPAGGHLVKRVIGLPGDVIKCCDEQGRISVNGVPLDEPYLKNGAQCNGPMIGCHWTAGPVPEGRMFVMGDHRDASGDSTVHLCRPDTQGCDPKAGFVPLDLVVGRVFVLVWPRDHFGWLNRPATFEDIDQ